MLSLFNQWTDVTATHLLQLLLYSVFGTSVLACRLSNALQTCVAMKMIAVIMQVVRHSKADQHSAVRGTDA